MHWLVRTNKFPKGYGTVAAKPKRIYTPRQIERCASLTTTDLMLAARQSPTAPPMVLCGSRLSRSNNASNASALIGVTPNRRASTFSLSSYALVKTEPMRKPCRVENLGFVLHLPSCGENLHDLPL
jgi:hypothetical protein